MGDGQGVWTPFYPMSFGGSHPSSVLKGWMASLSVLDFAQLPKGSAGPEKMPGKEGEWNVSVSDT